VDLAGGFEVLELLLLAFDEVGEFGALGLPGEYFLAVAVDGFFEDGDEGQGHGVPFSPESGVWSHEQKQIHHGWTPMRTDRGKFLSP